MKSMLELKGKLQDLYAVYSKYIDKAIQFILAFLVFAMIGREIGFMSVLKNPLIEFGLAVVCAFLPPVFTVLAAAALVLGHLYAASVGIMLIAALIFLLMFIFYLKLAPKTAIAVVLTALAFTLKIPAAAPVAFALVATPVYAVPVVCGTITYYMIQQAKQASAVGQSAADAGFFADMLSYAKSVLQNKEMWAMAVAVIVCMLAVYAVKRSGITHAWKVASVTGAVLYLIVVAGGDMVIGLKVSYASVILGGIAAIIIGLILELFFFAVDYSKCESFQYEDDEYYYYVKAVPKVGVSASEKTVKRISRRDDLHPDTEIIDSDELRRKAKSPEKEPRKKTVKKAPEQKKVAREDAEHMLLTQSLERELNLDHKE